MEAVQRNQDAASRFTGAAAPSVNQAGNAAAYRRNAWRPRPLSLQAMKPQSP